MALLQPVRIWTVFLKSAKNNCCVAAFLIGLIGAPAPSFATIYTFDQAVERFIIEDYPVYKMYAQFALKHHPPKGSIYLGIGSSPVAVIAFLQEYQKFNHDIIALNIPISGHGSVSGILAHSQNIIDVLSEFLPKEILDSGRDIIIMDHTDTGTSIYLGASMVQHYLNKMKLKNQIRLVGMGWSRFFLNPHFVGFPAEELSLPRSAITGATKGMKIFREHSKYLPESDNPGPLPKKESSPNYLFLRSEVAKLMAADPHLLEEFDDSILKQPDVGYYTAENCKSRIEEMIED